MTRTLTLERWVLMGSLPTMQRSTISSPDTDWSGQRVLWAVIVKSWFESSTPLTWLLLDQILIGGLPPSNKPYLGMSEYVAFRSISLCLPSAGNYTVRMLMPTGPLSPPSLTTSGKLSKMANSCVSHRLERPPRGGWPCTCLLIERVLTG